MTLINTQLLSLRGTTANHEALIYSVTLQDVNQLGVLRSNISSLSAERESLMYQQ